MATTPNLLLPLPDVSITTGPQWASLLNASFELVDTHDHTASKGVRVPSAGININEDLSFEGYNAIGFRSLRLDSQGGTLADPTDLTCLFVKNGELAYIDALGNEVVMTASGSVAGATGSITGLSSPASAVFSSITNSYTFSFDSSKPAKLNISEISLYEYDNASANPITLKTPAAVASAFSITLPAAQASGAVEFLSIDNSGVMNHATLAGTANQITVTQSVTAVTLSLPATLSTTTYLAGNGTAGAPTFAFASDTNTGVYWDSADVIGFAAGGVEVAAIGSTMFVPAGTAANPGVRFLSDTDTGIYRDSANVLGFSTGGSSRATIGSAGLDISAALSVGTTLNIAGGGAFKVTRFSGSLAAGATTTINAGATIYGAFGYAQNNAGGSYSPIRTVFTSETPDGGAAAPVAFQYATSGTSASVLRIKNYDPADTNTYNVVVFHA